jgi:mono/diheme cytochrome c family protein
VTSRFRLGMLVGLFALAGCDDAQWTGPILYRDSERFAKDLADKPKLQAAIRSALKKNFGDDLKQIRVPDSSGLRDDGRYLANFVRLGEKREPVVETDPKTGKTVPIAGGYALYRKNCLHCHGVFGAGDGPTTVVMYPKPRNFRPGIFKFTSTNPVNAKPTRTDLRKTINYGLHGTSMPGFEATMTPSEIEQVIDYTIFLSMRGETERYLIDEAMNNDDKDAEVALGDDVVKEMITKVASSWIDAESQVVNPSARRVDPTPESILRGRDLYLSTNPALPKLECIGCHGGSGKGNGPAFIDQSIFVAAALRFDPLDQAIDRFYKAEQEKAEAGTTQAKADPDGLAQFLGENPAVVAELRKPRGLMGNQLMGELPDQEFAAKVKVDPSAVATAARKLVPDLDQPDFRSLLVAKMDLWSKSLDAWDNPLRPANLIDGTYKGGRRPLDLYWRIAKGINGAKMPAHAGLLTDEQIWDVVNFVLALPLDPDLLPESAPVPAKPHAVAISSH